MSIATRFGANMKKARREAGMSQEEVGIRASLHRTEIGLLERGERTPRIDTAIKLAGALGVSLGQLTRGIAWRPGFARAGQFERAGGAGGKDAPKVSSTTGAK